MNDLNVPETRSQIRQRGLKKFAIGGGIFAAMLYLAYWLGAHRRHFSFELIAATLPFVLACIGFIEMMTGAPYLRLAQSWMALRGWQRGVLGAFNAWTVG